ncbi:MAG: amidohydrolase [Acidobacteriia bacterium]|nr:amidohydrolase [Terriglobia bacterium]
MASSDHLRDKKGSSFQREAEQGTAARRGADLVLLSGKIWTGEGGPEAPVGGRFAEAVAISAGRILDVGTNEEMRAYVGAHTRVIGLGGRLVVPGLIDSHVHLLEGGFQLLQIDLKDARSESEFVTRIAEKARSLAPGQWMLGGRWDEQAWPSAKLPTRWQIDAVTQNHAVFLSRYDGHAALANSLALKLAGVTRDTPEPADGVIVRDKDTGEPTGVLKDGAIDLVARVVPRPTEAEMEAALRAALQEAARVGVTSLHNITTDTDSATGSFTDEVQLVRRAEREGWLTTRLYEIIPIAHWKVLPDAGLSAGMGDDFVKLGAVKGFADGSLGSGTAWMFEPFDDDPKNRGLPMALMDPPSKMEALVRGAAGAHIQPCIHAIGDRAVAEMLDLYARVGGDNVASYRFRIEHAQHVRPEDFGRFAKLGVIASMQPYHAIDDGRWAEQRLGARRSRTSYAWRSMLEAGAPLAFGSDWPVAPLDPLLGIYAAVARATIDGKHRGGWVPEERLTVEEALRAYTTGSAYAAFEEKEKGTLAPGKLADLVVLSEDLFSITPERIREARVAMTIVGGRVIYSALPL